MNPPDDSEAAELSLPETQHELEALLEALHALNAALDQYEADSASKGESDPAPDPDAADRFTFV